MQQRFKTARQKLIDRKGRKEKKKKKKARKKKVLFPIFFFFFFFSNGHPEGQEQKVARGREPIGEG
jgi:hypothetical protein